MIRVLPLLLCLSAGGCALFIPLKRDTALNLPIEPERSIVLTDIRCLRDGLTWESGLPLLAMAETAGTQLGLLEPPRGNPSEQPPYRLNLQIHLYRSLCQGLPGTDTLCLVTLTLPSPDGSPEASLEWTARTAVQGRDNQYPPRAEHLYNLIKAGLREMDSLRQEAALPEDTL